MTSQKGRHWIIGRDMMRLAVVRFEWGRPAILGTFRTMIGMLDVDAFAPAVALMLRDYVRIHAPAGCRNAVEQFEREAPDMYAQRIALAMYQSNAVKQEGIRLVDESVGMLIDGLTSRRGTTRPLG